MEVHKKLASGEMTQEHYFLDIKQVDDKSDVETTYILWKSMGLIDWIRLDSGAGSTLKIGSGEEKQPSSPPQGARSSVASNKALK